VKKAEEKPRWFFVDEAGDPVFYGKGKRIIVGSDGCSRTFSVGFIRTYDPQSLRSKLADVRLEVLNERYFAAIPSVQKSLRAFHAKDDCPEVRKLVFTALEKMDFGVQVIVGRKQEYRFRCSHDGSQDKFYDDLVGRLFHTQMHLSHQNTIVFATRGNKPRQRALRAAVQTSAEKFRAKYNNATTTEIDVQTSQPAQEPALQVVDYALWAVQRAFERGEMRYFDYLREKIELVWDIYDVKKIQVGESTVYDRRKNLFDIKKASPLS
jgi:nicotinamide mononucleotide adenylyltransferase